MSSLILNLLRPIINKIPGRITLSIVKRFNVDPNLFWRSNRLYGLEQVDENIGMLRVRRFYNKNHVGYGLAWGCGMESALRIINLTQFINRTANDTIKTELTHIISEETKFLINNFEWQSRNTHFLSCAVALLHSNYILGEKHTIVKPQHIREIITDFARFYFLADGTSREGSVHYHTLAVELLNTIEDLDILFFKYLITRFNWQGAINFINQTHYQLYWVPIGDFDSTMCSAHLINYDRFKYINEKIVNRHSNLLKKQDSFEDFGIYYLSSKHLNLQLINKSDGPYCGHSHGDSLSIILSFDGVPAIIERGVECYKKNRKKYRSAKAHSSPIANATFIPELNASFDQIECNTKHLTNVYPKKSEIIAEMISNEKRIRREVKFLNEHTISITDSAINCSLKQITFFVDQQWTISSNTSEYIKFISGYKTMYIYAASDIRSVTKTTAYSEYNIKVSVIEVRICPNASEFSTVIRFK